VHPAPEPLPRESTHGLADGGGKLRKKNVGYMPANRPFIENIKQNYPTPKGVGHLEPTDSCRLSVKK
jgi:hypothetical protein